MPGTPANPIEQQGVALIADGADQVLRAAREQLMKGASQIKIMAGGGVASLYDPLDATQYTEREMRAAVDAATDWGTYVCAHVYTSHGIRRAIAAGVRSIEHGQLADEATVRLMADEGVWWSIQPFLADEDANPYSDPRQQAKQREVSEGTVRAFELLGKHKLRLAFGTASSSTPPAPRARGGNWPSSRATCRRSRRCTRPPARPANCSRCRDRAPYEGRLGVIAAGALADLLVVDGDPETALDWLGTPETSLRPIMKGGRLARQTLA